MVAQPHHSWTVDEYLAFENASEERHEFIDGEIYLMSGSSEAHVLITDNLLESLRPQARQSGCRLYSHDLRVRVSNAQFFYPDLIGICGDRQFDDGSPPALLNPQLIIEVLSPSTEVYDRTRKFELYRALASLREYVLVAQDRPQIECYVRGDDASWAVTWHVGLEASAPLASMAVTLSLADVYRDVTFEERPQHDTPTNV